MVTDLDLKIEGGYVPTLEEVAEPLVEALLACEVPEDLRKKVEELADMLTDWTRQSRELLAQIQSVHAGNEFPHQLYEPLRYAILGVVSYEVVLSHYKYDPMMKDEVRRRGVRTFAQRVLRSAEMVHEAILRQG